MANSIFDNPYYQAIVGSAGGVAQYAAAQSNAMNQPRYNVPSAVSTGGQPVYNLGQSLVQAGSYSPSHGHGLIGAGIGSGAQIGSSIGTALGGPAGTLLGGAAGAVGGAIVGGIGEFFAGGKAADQQNQLIASIQSQQNQYNKDQQNFDQDYLAKQQYNDRIA